MLAETKSAKGAATRDQILDAASRLIHLQGYHCTSLDDVLRESGVGKGNFYYHFRSKEDLGYAIIERLVTAFLARTLEPAFADPEAAAGPDLRGVAAHAHRGIGAGPGTRGAPGRLQPGAGRAFPRGRPRRRHPHDQSDQGHRGHGKMRGRAEAAPDAVCEILIQGPDQRKRGRAPTGTGEIR